MDDELEAFGYAARQVYEPAIIGQGSRIGRGRVLWDQFEGALGRCLANRNVDTRQLTERVNEMAIAKIIAEDPDVTGDIVYEPDDISPDGRKIDFVIFGDEQNKYVEVKTVHPKSEDTERDWANYLARKERHPPGVYYTVAKEAMGGAIYANTFASRSNFLTYALEFESRLTGAKELRGGPGILIICGNGFAWSVDDLEDFADYYHTGRHRLDDPFALMEQHHIEAEGIQLLRNIDHIGYMRRGVNVPQHQDYAAGVRGPRIMGPPA
jgi:hypothetical protein